MLGRKATYPKKLEGQRGMGSLYNTDLKGKRSLHLSIRRVKTLIAMKNLGISILSKMWNRGLRPRIRLLKGHVHNKGRCGYLPQSITTTYFSFTVVLSIHELSCPCGCG